MKKTYWIHALTPMHVGSGRGVGYIDLPIIREKVTNWPLIPGSTVKGVIRDYHAGKEGQILAAAFGNGGNEKAANGGSIVFSDARLVCLPVRSLYGTFAWCASPVSLARLKRDLEFAGYTDLPAEVQVVPGRALVCSGSAVRENANGKMYLEDIDLEVAAENCDKWAEFIAERIFANPAEQAEFKKRFVVLSEDVFNFLCETGTEVAAHIKIQDDTKTVQPGALWYEESLPTETILCGITWCDKVYSGGLTPEKLIADICPDTGLRLQFGGKGSTGKGQARMSFKGAK